MLPSSPRARRRLIGAALVALVASAIALVVALGPSHSGHVPQHFTAEPAQLVKVERQVPLRAQDRRSIDALLDRFVPAAVARRDPSAAYGLATPALRAGTSRAAWAHGNVPVQPLDVRDSSFHGWAPSYTFRNEVNFELLVHAKPGGDLGAIAYTVDVKRVGGRWLVDSFVPNALFAPEGRQPRIVSHLDYGPGAR